VTDPNEIVAVMAYTGGELRLLDIVSALIRSHGLRNPLTDLHRGQVTPASAHDFLIFAGRATALGITPSEVLKTLQGDPRFVETWVEMDEPAIAVPYWSLK